MKNWLAETLRPARAAVETRDTLRSLAAQIDAAAGDPGRQAEMLKAARAVAVSYSGILRMALKDCRARQHRFGNGHAQPLWGLK